VIHPCDRQRDGRTDRRTGNSIYRAKHICYMLSRAKMKPASLKYITLKFYYSLRLFMNAFLFIDFSKQDKKDSYEI